MGQQASPGYKPLWYVLVLCVKHHDVRSWDVAILRSRKDVRQQLGFDYQKSRTGCFEMVSELELGIGRVGAGEATANGHDAQEEHRVVYLNWSATKGSVRHGLTYTVEAMETDAISRSDTGCVEARSKLSDDFPGLIARDGFGWIRRINVDLRRGSMVGTFDFGFL